MSGTHFARGNSGYPFDVAKAAHGISPKADLSARRSKFTVCPAT